MAPLIDITVGRDLDGGLAIYRDGYFTSPADAARLLVHFRAVARNPSDWFAPMASQIAKALEDAIAETQQHEEAA